MRVLVIDTALGACTVGLCENDRVLAQRSEVMARGHSERLGGFARDVVASAAVGFDSIDRIGVTVGPGSFTGLRVGLAFALGLGQALGRPVIGLSSLHALAWTIEGGPHGPVAAAIDARRGEVYLQTWRDGEPLGPPEALTIETARERLSMTGLDWRWVGSGAALLAEVSAPTVTEPTVLALASLTARLDPTGHPARPLYLRAPDATPPTRLPGQARPVAQSG
ncbi:tRNA (adenosine(37)-N6)-threonylcarbamoyltransferase complex dimerization subunit type 1 TsaB [Brevundimonas aurifodinae]|uniref:tRNA (Adenosine(37)-N6)-threonylcarbamoyltransferase complex dimerization subunit type 1 TsaB n=2 Tax=Brevundimonas TaxID=41275 RepID=A0ABV1NIC7_9CAUL|nr:MAG: tRNA (adenosine(37)-N6)-threonylcarbamoyltransferase complex dimerization subunit type 1 TsaB [Brevundimonas sp. 12-68-7]OYX35760.1 MAG: tRNA (adenosine(37)-N6)-threonylcarbamoyltransferase complex dimerization subunit type 1 TsaB [Brevundimonas subvibrioides]